MPVARTLYSVQDRREHETINIYLTLRRVVFLEVVYVDEDDGEGQPSVLTMTAVRGNVRRYQGGTKENAMLWVSLLR